MCILYLCGKHYWKYMWNKNLFIYLKIINISKVRILFSSYNKYKIFASAKFDEHQFVLYWSVIIITFTYSILGQLNVSRRKFCLFIHRKYFLWLDCNTKDEKLKIQNWKDLKWLKRAKLVSIYNDSKKSFFKTYFFLIPHKEKHNIGPVEWFQEVFVFKLVFNGHISKFISYKLAFLSYYVK